MAACIEKTIAGTRPTSRARLKHRAAIEIATPSCAVPRQVRDAQRVRDAAADRSDPIMGLLARLDVSGVQLPGGVGQARAHRQAQLADERSAAGLVAQAIERARDSLHDVRRRLEPAAARGSTTATNALAGLHVGLREYEQAQLALAAAECRVGSAHSGCLVATAAGLLEPGLDAEDDGSWPLSSSYAEFTVITPHPDRAAASLARIRPRLYDIDERGMEMSMDARAQAGLPLDEYYTPNWVSDVETCEVAARLMLDTKGAMWSALQRTIVSIITEALIADNVPAHIIGVCPDLHHRFKNWPSGKSEPLT